MFIMKGFSCMYPFFTQTEFLVKLHGDMYLTSLPEVIVTQADSKSLKKKYPEDKNYCLALIFGGENENAVEFQEDAYEKL